MAAGADPDLEDPDRVTPLNMALLNLHFEFAAYMIKAGADVDKWDFLGRSPLYMAADVSTLPTKGNGAVAVLPSEDSTTAIDVARMLLDAGANPNLQLKRRPPYRDVPQDRGGDTILAQGATALLRAARAGDAPFRRAPVETRRARRLAEQGRRHAADGGCGRRIRTRVTRGRNRTNEGVLATMGLLLEGGADINARMVTDAPRAAEYSASANIAARTGRGGRASQMPTASAAPHETALHGAAEHGYTPFVKFLAEHGATCRRRTPMAGPRSTSRKASASPA